MTKLTVRKSTTTQEWVIDQGAKKGVATIYFRNEKFDKVIFYAKNPYTREDWRLIAFIEAQITKIERSLECRSS